MSKYTTILKIISIRMYSTYTKNNVEEMKEFFANPRQQEIVKKAGLRVSVGFDGHRVEDYLPRRVVNACRKLEELGILSPFVEEK